MATIPADTSFVREGRPLSEWLLDLISEDPGVRDRAGEMVGAVRLALASPETDLSEAEDPPAEHKRNFEKAIQSAVASPGFPRRTFLMRAAELQVRASTEWSAAVDAMMQADPQEERVTARLLERAKQSSTEEERSRHMRRLGRIMCAAVRRTEENPQVHEAAAMSVGCIHLGLVTPWATPAVPEAPEAVWMMLENKGTRYLGAELLENAGAVVAPFFLDELLRFYLEELNDADRWNYSRMIASVGRGDHRVIEEMLRRAEAPATGDSAVDMRRVYASILGCMALDAATPAVIDVFRRFSQSQDDVQRSMAAANLGRLLPSKSEAVDRLLEITRDPVMEVVGPAINSLGELGLDAERVVPRLAELLTEFEEYDPDEGYGGDMARVCRALRAFGAEAAPAVPALSTYLHGRVLGQDPRFRDWRFPAEVLAVLESIGSSAGSAMPVLRAVREVELEQRRQAELNDLTDDSEDEDDEDEHSFERTPPRQYNSVARVDALIAQLETV